MEAIQSVITFMQNLGAACMMPIFVFIIGLIVRVPLKQLLKASVTVGCGFIGTFMVMDLLAEYIGPISTGLVEKFNLSLDVIDVGWPVTGSFAWAVPIAPLIFVGVFALNILLIVVGFTRTLDVDIWNYWGFMLAGAMVYYSTDNVVFGLLASLITAAVTFRLADYAAPVTQHIYPGISFPHTCSIFWMPYAKFMDKIYDRIPGFNKLDADPEHLKEKIGFFGDPMFIGLLVGAALSILAGQDVSSKSRNTGRKSGPPGRTWDWPASAGGVSWFGTGRCASAGAACTDPPAFPVPGSSRWHRWHSGPDTPTRVPGKRHGASPPVPYPPPWWWHRSRRRR